MATNGRRKTKTFLFVVVAAVAGRDREQGEALSNRPVGGNSKGAGSAIYYLPVIVRHARGRPKGKKERKEGRKEGRRPPFSHFGVANQIKCDLEGPKRSPR